MVLAEYLYPSEKHGLKEDHGNADHLCGGLDLAEPACRNNDSVASRDDESERRYRKLTEHDDRRSPKKRGADIGKSGHGSVIADKNPEKRGKYDEKRTEKTLTERLRTEERAVIPGFYGSMFVRSFRR